MKRLTTLTGKNLPKLSVAKPGWPEVAPYNSAEFLTTAESRQAYMEEAIATGDDELIGFARGVTEKAVRDFTRVCDQTGLSERLRKD